MRNEIMNMAMTEGTIQKAEENRKQSVSTQLAKFNHLIYVDQNGNQKIYMQDSEDNLHSVQSIDKPILNIQIDKNNKVKTV